MVKKCILCGKPAGYCIKGSSECYCKECAENQFGDLTYLVAVEEEAKKLRNVVEERIGGLEEEHEGSSEEPGD